MTDNGEQRTLGYSSMRSPRLPLPYPDGLLVDVVWPTLPIHYVEVQRLVPTQEAVNIQRALDLLRGAQPEGGDEALHIYDREGVFFIHDGHTRWLINGLVHNHRSLPCRIWSSYVSVPPEECAYCGGRPPYGCRYDCKSDR